MEAPSTLAIIVANGTLPHPEESRQRVRHWLDEQPDVLLVAANGGARNALSLGLTPHVVIGDLDSMDDVTHEHLANRGCQFKSAHTDKDETDLELALRYAVEDNGAQRIRVLGALGGRLDQTLANILLLTLPLLDQVDIRIVEGAQTAWLVRDKTDVRGQPADTVSLIPLGGDARGVSTQGLEYSLSDATLPFGPSLGISNELTAPLAHVTVREGLLLAVHTSGGAP